MKEKELEKLERGKLITKITDLSLLKCISILKG
jgi:hypothetical protein